MHRYTHITHAHRACTMFTYIYTYTYVHISASACVAQHTHRESHPQRELFPHARPASLISLQESVSVFPRGYVPGSHLGISAGPRRYRQSRTFQAATEAVLPKPQSPSHNHRSLPVPRVRRYRLHSLPTAPHHASPAQMTRLQRARRGKTPTPAVA